MSCPENVLSRKVIFRETSVTHRKCLVRHDEGHVRTAKQRFCQFLAYDSKLRSMLTAVLLFVHCRSFLYAKFTIWSQTSLSRCLSRSVLLYLIMSYVLCGGHFCLTWISYIFFRAGMWLIELQMYVKLHKVQLQHFQNIVIVISTLLIVLLLIRPFYGPLSGTTRVSWYQKKSSGLSWRKGR